MGKVICKCGGWISDTCIPSDWLAEGITSNKFEEVFPGDDEKEMGAWDFANSMNIQMYECTSCGRIAFFKDILENAIWYKPESEKYNGVFK